MLQPARIMIVIACGLLGYFGANAFTVNRAETFRDPQHLPQNGSSALAPIRGNPEESALVAEWEQFRRDHGAGGADLAALYSAVKETKDSYRRRAFRAALIAEWAVRDPAAALAYLLQNDSGNAPQLMREWMRIDPDAAITGILGGGAKARNALRGLQSDIARMAPVRLAEVASALIASESRWDTSTQDAFAVFAEKDQAAARAAAESVTGPLRAQALAGVAKAWAEQDGPAALAWAEAMPAGETRDAALRGALIGWAKRDPVAALDKIDLAPPGGIEGYHASDTGAQVLREAGSRDWKATIQWLVDHPGKLGNASLSGLQSVLSQRLVRDPAATLREISASELPGLVQTLGNSVLNEGYMARDEIWSWLDGQPRNSFTESVRSSLLNAIGYKEPLAALDFLERLPDADHKMIERGTQSMVNGGTQMHLIEDLLKQASSKLRPYLIQAAFQYGSENFAHNPERWIERLGELPEDRRLSATHGLARGWAAADPQAAAQWAIDLQDPRQRSSALESATATWAQSDPREAAAWINTLPAGTSRDAAAQALVSALAPQQAEMAWTWALSIGGEGSRTRALQTAYQAIRRKDPATAEQMLRSSDLPPEQVELLRAIPDPRGGRLVRPARSSP